MKKSMLFTLLFIFIGFQSAFSLYPFQVYELALTHEGELVASFYNEAETTWVDRYVDVRISIYEDQTLMLQEYHWGTYVNQFGYFGVWVGWGENDYGSIGSILTTADARIIFEVLDDDEWNVVAVKNLAEMLRCANYSNYYFMKNNDSNPNDKNTAQNKMQFTRPDMAARPDMNQSLLPLISTVAQFDASRGSTFIYTGNDASLKVINPKIGQIIYVSKSDGEGLLSFSDVGIATGETYAFMFNGKIWSRIR